MKAVIVEEYGGPEVLQIREIPTPVPGPGRLLVKLSAAGVNPVDTYLRSGAQGYTPALPFTPGLDGAGTVEEIGDGVIGFHTGMKVYISGTVSGTYAEYCLCSPGQVFPLSDRLDWFEGACLGTPYFTAARALFTLGDAVTGETVLVHGASGGVGLASLQLAAGRGLAVYGTAGSAEGYSLVRKNGAIDCFNHLEKNYSDAIREKTGGGGFNLIVEMRADLNLETDLKLLAPGGRIVVVGSRGRIEIAPRDIMTSESRILGLKGGRSSADERRKYSQMVSNGIDAGLIKPPVSHLVPLSDASLAHRQVMNESHRGSIVLEIMN